MISLAPGTRVYVAVGATDMRKAINGLSVLVETRLKQSALSGHLFVFCNRARTIVKALYWDRAGPVVLCDETTVQVLDEPGRAPQAKS